MMVIFQNNDDYFQNKVDFSKQQIFKNDAGYFQNNNSDYNKIIASIFKNNVSYFYNEV